MKRILLISFLLSLQLNAKVRLPEIWSDYAVLQQNTSILLWGNASVKTKITVRTSWSKDQLKTYSNGDGYWQIRIETPVASFYEHAITVCDGSETRIQHLLIGEVYLISGQSNCEMPMKGFSNQPIRGADTAISNASANSGVRMVKIKRNIQLQEATEVSGKWQLSTPENLPQFSALGYYFGLEMRRLKNIPIGIINSTYGGTPIEAWLDAKSVSNYVDNKPYLIKYDSQKRSVLYNGMIVPISNYAINGMIWYQGEGNSDSAEDYGSKLTDLINTYRSRFKNKDLPVAIVEIAPFNYADSSLPWFIRAEQFRISKELQNVLFTSTSDLVDSSEIENIHPADKLTIAKRLALQFINRGDTINCFQNPYPIEATKIDGGILVVLDERTNSLHPTSEKMPFLVGNGIDFENAKSWEIIEGTNQLRILTNRSDITVLRYCYTDYYRSTLLNSCGFPLIPFEIKVKP